MSTKELNAQAKMIRTHIVIFQDNTEILAAVRAMQGRTTKSIAEELGITESEAQYRITKAQRAMGTFFRRDYRSGLGAFSKFVDKATTQRAREIVAQNVASQFAAYAKRP
jgi:predicted transcriptional regulator